ncbi:MAG: DUF3794 domain-containing protein [Oscillospiraceae bacterium]|nr:DUF3794 domain-containing protein [Oscillospiraceae bacterium]
MDYKVTKENFTVPSRLGGGVSQQSVELDYILPDYYPEIFKVLNLRILPSIFARTLNGTRLEYELSAKIRLTYVSESGEMCAAEQVLTYNRSAELSGAAKSPKISIMPYTESASCRVSGKRRADIRGIISISVTATADEARQAVSEASGDGLQLRKSLVTYPSKRIAVTKRITVVDEVDLGQSKPAVKTVIRADAAVITADKKILSGKLLTKGEAEISLLYVPEDNSNKAESIRFAVPFSQISDVEGLDERYDVMISANVSDCEIKPTAKNGNNTVSCELNIEISCLAMRFESVLIATDAYSTVYESSLEMSEEDIECVPQEISESCKTKASLTYYDGEIVSVMCAGAEVGKLDAVTDSDRSVSVRGRITYFAYAENESGMPIYLEGTDEFEKKLPEEASSCSIDAHATVAQTAFKLTSSNAMEITADIRLKGYLFGCKSHKFINGITVDEASPLEKDCDIAMKLYYAEKGEEPWDIAKRTHTTLSAITEENDIGEEVLTEPKMILIPIVD